MSSSPARHAAKLDTLAADLRRADRRVGEAVAAGRETQGRLEEQASQVTSRVATLRNLTTDTSERVATGRGVLKDAERRTDEVGFGLDALAREIGQARSHIARQSQHWQQQRQQAAQWVDRAERELAAARSAEESARASLQRCEQ